MTHMWHFYVTRRLGIVFRMLADWVLLGSSNELGVFPNCVSRVLGGFLQPCSEVREFGMILVDIVSRVVGFFVLSSLFCRAHPI